MERVRRGNNKKDKGKNVSIEAGETCKKDKRKNVGIKAGEGTGQGVDYISYLPEVILLHILSFLPLKDLIVVSLLSKQWKYLWTKISSLNLDDTEFTRNIILKGHPCPSYGAPNSRHDRSQCQSNSICSARKKFADVVDRTFLLHTGCTMKSLRLSLVYDDDQNIYANRIDTWVHFAFTTSVKELELNFNFKGTFEIFNELGSAIWRSGSKEPYDLPYNYFAPKVLETLTLTFWKFKATSFRVLSSLRKLYLKHTELLICSIGELASPCPVLEDLILESCRIPNGFLVSEGDIMIKRISLKECSLDDMFRIDLSAPNLLMLTIAGDWLRSASIRKASHLTDATIKFRKVFTDHEQGDALLSLLAGLNNCEYLRLATVAVEIVPREVCLPQQLRMDLQNLKKLELFVGITKQELRRICCLLRSSPNLENLILVLHGPWLVDIESLIPGMPEFDAETYLELESKNSPFLCLQNNLKIITIKGLVGRSIEVQATLFLLKHATLLENLTIAFAEDTVAMMIHPRYYREFRKNSHKLLDFIKTSTRAQVEILGDPIQRTI